MLWLMKNHPKETRPTCQQRSTNTRSRGGMQTNRWTGPAELRVGSTTPPGWSGYGNELKGERDTFTETERTDLRRS